MTDKADGEHYLLMVSGHPKYAQSIYFINNRMEIHHTGLKMKIDHYNRSLFDGELIHTRTNKLQFLIFDCFFLSGEDYRPKPLHNLDNRNDRYQAIIGFSKQLGPLVDTVAPDINLEINHKKYLFHEPQAHNSILDLAHQVYQPNSYNYHLDGLIFTPYNVPYPKISLQKLIRWNLFKWKPLDQLSIDFFVHIVKKNGVKSLKMMLIVNRYGNIGSSLTSDGYTEKAISQFCSQPE